VRKRVLCRSILKRLSNGSGEPRVWSCRGRIAEQLPMGSLPIFSRECSAPAIRRRKLGSSRYNVWRGARLVATIGRVLGSRICAGAWGTCASVQRTCGTEKRTCGGMQGTCVDEKRICGTGLTICAVEMGTCANKKRSCAGIKGICAAESGSCAAEVAEAGGAAGERGGGVARKGGEVLTNGRLVERERREWMDAVKASGRSTSNIQR
jgi:hypothetical protein